MIQKHYTVDFSNVKYIMQLHEVLYESLSFPDYYGGNMDALWDCLKDMLPEASYIEIQGFENLKKHLGDYADKVISIFREVKNEHHGKYRDNFLIVLIHQDGSKEELT